MWQQPSDGSEQSQAAHADEETLRAYAAGTRTPDEAQLQHIARCMRCLSELSHLRTLVAAPAVEMEPADCPSLELLQSFALGELSARDRKATEAHVRTCLSCAAEVAATRTFLLDHPIPESVPAGASSV